jgi:pimeloyl-[acyl-carrier protein] methyl ester esterase
MSTALYQEHGGSGAPLVLLHGWGMNLRVFDALRTSLAQHCALTALDLPGHGASAWPADWSAGRQLQAIAAAVPPGATLVGWSLGGQLALSLAADRACDIRRLVLIASTPCFTARDGWEHGLPAATLQQFADALEQDPRQLMSQFLDLQVRGSAAAAEVRAALNGALERHGAAQLPALRAGLGLLADNDLREQARTLAIPALIVAGEHDQVVPAAASQALAGLLPRAQLQLVRRSGHAPFLSHPETVAAALLQFLRATEPA